MRTIGVLGGIGPQATMDFEARVHRVAQRLVPAHYNEGYPPMVTVFLRHPPVLVEDGARVASSTIGPNVTIEAGAVVQGSTVRDTIIGRGAVVRNATIEHSLIGDDAQVEQMNLHNMVVAKDEMAEAP